MSLFLSYNPGFYILRGTSFRVMSVGFLRSIFKDLLHYSPSFFWRCIFMDSNYFNFFFETWPNFNNDSSSYYFEFLIFFIHGILELKFRRIKWFFFQGHSSCNRRFFKQSSRIPRVINVDFNRTYVEGSLYLQSSFVYEILEPLEDFFRGFSGFMF